VTEQAGWIELAPSLRGVSLSHRIRAGQVPLLMVHGIGPGTNGDVNFSPLIARLSRRCAIHLIDLAGFGRSDRLPAPPFFDVPFWLDQIEQAIVQIIRMHQRTPLLIGNSVGGALSLRIAARRKDLPHIVAIGAPASAEATPELRAFWSVPQDADALAAAMRPMTGAALTPDADVVESRLAAFRSDAYRDYFATMLADPSHCLSQAILPEHEWQRVASPVTLLHGDRDRACPADATIALQGRLEQADLMLLSGCGHNVMSERPDETANLIEYLAGKIE